MAKKLYDIVPPAVARKKATAVKTAARVPINKKPRKAPIKAQPKITSEVSSTPPPPVMPESRPLAVPPSSRRPWFRGVVVGVLALLVILGGWAYLKLPKADIQIWPLTDQVNFTEKISAKTSATSVDDSVLVIPAQYVEIEKEIQQQFPATGSTSDDGKATGTITIYNKISPSAPFTLIKGTHFLSDSGKYFLTLARVTVPAMKGKTPGSIEVQVQAEQSGDDYNIGSSKFSIPKLNGTVYYYSLYGQSTSSMAGGFSGTVKKVTADDLQTAKEMITKKAIEEAQNALKSNLSQDQILLEGSATSSIISTNSDVKALAVVNQFTETGKAKASALVYKKQDLDNLITNYLDSHLSEKSRIVENSLQVKPSFQSVDFQKGVLQFTIDLNARAYQAIDKNGLISRITNKTADQVKQTIDELYPNIVSQLKVNFWPFWVSKVPSDIHRINIDLQF